MPYSHPNFELSCSLYAATWPVKCQGGAWWILSSWMAAPVCLAPRQDESKLRQVRSHAVNKGHKHTDTQQLHCHCQHWKTPFGFGHSTCSVLWCALFLLDADTWSKEDCLTLLERIRSLLPDGDTMKYKTTESHFDWEKVGFGGFTGDMCKQKWQKVSTEVSQIPVS